MMQLYDQHSHCMMHAAYFATGEIFYHPTAAGLRRAVRTHQRIDPCRVWYRPCDEWREVSNAYLEAWRMQHPTFAYGFAFTDAYDPGDCADASEVYGA